MASIKDFQEARAMIPVSNLIDSVFVTRACPRRCSYCNIVTAPTRDKQIPYSKWPGVFDLLDNLGSTFHLLLGNEPLLMGPHCVSLVNHLENKQTPYAMYTTGPMGIWERWKDELKEAGLRSISIGVDFPRSQLDQGDTMDEFGKASRAYEILEWAKDNGLITHATVTLNGRNLNHIEELFSDLKELDCWIAVNPVHYDTDRKGSSEGFDFFAPVEQMESYLLVDKKEELHKTIHTVKKLRDESGVKVFNQDESLDAIAEFSSLQDWHCTSPNVFSLDPDGFMRVCSYRKGSRSNQIHISEFEKEPQATTVKWLDAWYKDSRDCPGCMFTLWHSAELEDAKTLAESAQYFGKHGSTSIPLELWDNVEYGNQGEGEKRLSVHKPLVPMVTRSGQWESEIKPQMVDKIENKEHLPKE